MTNVWNPASNPELFLNFSPCGVFPDIRGYKTS